VPSRRRTEQVILLGAYCSIQYASFFGLDGRVVTVYSIHFMDGVRSPVRSFDPWSSLPHDVPPGPSSGPVVTRPVHGG